MSAADTDQPTERHLRQARKRGIVAFSTYLTGSIALLLTVAVVFQVGNGLTQRYADWAAEVFTAASSSALDPLLQLENGLALGIGGLIPIFIVLFVATASVGWIHIRPAVSFRAILPDLQRLNPTQRWHRLFGAGMFKRVAFDSLVALGLLGLAVFFLGSRLESLSQAPRRPLGGAFEGIWSSLVWPWFSWALLFLVVVGGIDYALKRLQLFKRLTMSRTELEKEERDQSGAPVFRHLRRRRHEQLWQVDSDTAPGQTRCLLTSRHGFAVALAFDSDIATPPVVIAKGRDGLARQLKQQCDAQGIPTIDAPQVDHLYDHLHVGQPIPRALFEPAAQVLAKVGSS